MYLLQKKGMSEDVSFEEGHLGLHRSSFFFLENLKDPMMAPASMAPPGSGSMSHSFRRLGGAEHRGRRGRAMPGRPGLGESNAPETVRMIKSPCSSKIIPIFAI